jgi:hypothetical protein
MTNGGAVEMVGDFPFMLSLVEAFLVLSVESEFDTDSAEKPAQDFLVCFDLGFWRMSQSL